MSYQPSRTDGLGGDGALPVPSRIATAQDDQLGLTPPRGAVYLMSAHHD